MRNWTEYDAEKLLESLKHYELLDGKVFHDNGFITINFHKYFDVKICDDMFEFFDTHSHPYDNEEIIKEIEYLLNEEIIFYEKYKFPFWKQRYSKYYLPELLKKKDKKYCRVYSAIKIYVDN